MGQRTAIGRRLGDPAGAALTATGQDGGSEPRDHRRHWRLPVVHVRRDVIACPECSSEDCRCTGSWRLRTRPDAYYRCRACRTTWRVRWVRGDR